jgi:hypothetical protein
MSAITFKNRFWVCDHDFFNAAKAAAIIRDTDKSLKSWANHMQGWA